MSVPYVGPVPAYSNVPINAQYYQPRRYVISAITLGQTTLVQTTNNHDYSIGQLVRLIIPPSFGCRQLNESQGYVLSIPSSNEMILSIDSLRNVDPYVSSAATTKSQTLGIGDINSGPINNSGRVNNTTYIEGSFLDISPN